MIGLIEVSAGKADGECLDFSRGGTSHQSNDHGGVNTSAEQCSQRNVARQTNAYCLGQTVLKLLQALLFRLGLVDAVVRKIPILTRLNLAAGKFQKMAGWQLLDALKGCERIGNVPKVEEVEQPVRIHTRQIGSALQDCFDLRGEQQAPFVQSVV